MTSTGAGQPQFRYTQPPSKVLHVRNLPWECSDEELVQLCKPFGKVVNTKVNVGANHNQAFVEFADLNQAIAMVSYYASSSEPAQVRGKTVYLQYSNRQEIVTSKNSGDIASNVLLVTVEGVEAGDVSIDVLHLVHMTDTSLMAAWCMGDSAYKHSVPFSSDYEAEQFTNTSRSVPPVFSAFGFVHKIATFEKSAGFQALVQFSDASTANSAKSALEGRSIPRYLLPDHVGPCHLRISFSAHNDLNVKFQSHRSRDFTNPFLPVAPSAIDGSGQCGIGPDGKRRELESNVLLASIENMQYAVTIDVLHTVFSAFGTVQKIAIFEKSAGFQALVQYPDVPTAVAAKDALEGHCIYDGGFCKLHLSYSRHTDLNVKVNNDRSRDYTNPGLPPTQPPVLGQAPGTGTDVVQASPTAGPAYPLPQYGAALPPQDSGAKHQMWEYDQSSNPQQGMPVQPPRYMNHPQQGGVPAVPPSHHGPPCAPGHYQGPPVAPTSMRQMAGQMGPPGHINPGMAPQGGQTHRPQPQPPPYQQICGPGPQGMTPANGGGYYM